MNSQLTRSDYDIKERTLRFSLTVIRYLEHLPKNYIYQTLGKQLLRSSTSIGANIIEAQASSSKKDFQNFINHSLKSANETKYWLIILDKTFRLSTTKALITECDELCKILGASILRLKGKR